MTTAHVESAGGLFAQSIHMRHHRVECDEAAAVGGADGGPNPTELLLGALGSCVDSLGLGPTAHDVLPVADDN